MEAGIVSWGVYLPYWRLQRQAIGQAFGTGGGRGTRAVASYDEDTTSMAVEAGRRALAVSRCTGACRTCSSPPRPGLSGQDQRHDGPRRHWGWPPAPAPTTSAGSVRSSWATVQLAALAGSRAPALAVVSDLRTGLPGGPDETPGGRRRGGLSLRPGGRRGRAARARRRPATSSSTGGGCRGRPTRTSVGGALRRGGLRAAGPRGLRPAPWPMPAWSRGDVDHLIVTGLHARAVATLKKSLGVVAERVVPDHTGLIGNLGAAQAGLALADVLERAGAGQVIVVVEVADGADAVVLRTTGRLSGGPGGPTAGRPASGGRAGRRRSRRPVVRRLPVVAGPGAPGAATAARPRAPRCPGHRYRAVEVRLQRQPLPGLRLPPPAAHPGLPLLSGRRPDGARAYGRRARAPSPPTPSTAWPSACRPRWSASSSTSTAVDGTGAR